MLPQLASCVMSASQIMSELPKLSHEDRRRLAEAIFELEEEADLLRDCNRRADEHFRLLDLMEERDAQIRRGG
jgi:hypothetical protein